MILDVMQTCNSSALSIILPIVKNILLLIQIIVPILLIVFSIIQLSQGVMNPDLKDQNKKIFNKFIAAAVVFIVPVLLNVVMGMVGESTEFSNCWNNANDVSINDGNYIDNSHGKEKTKIVDDNSNGYEKGDTTDTKKNSDSKKNNDSKNNNTAVNKYIFVGDSRTVGMYSYKSNNYSTANYSSGGAHEVGNDVYIAETSQGLSWLKSTGMPAAKKYFSNSSAVIILLGVNDTYNSDGYISYLKDNYSSWKSTGVRVYFSAVGPCNGGYSSNNASISSFNSKVQANLPSGVTWIDTYSYLNSNGFNTTDGLHYDKATSEKIYNYIKSKV